MQVGLLAPEPIVEDSRATREIRRLAGAGHDVWVVTVAGANNAVESKGSTRVETVGLRSRAWPLRPLVSLLNWLALLIRLWRANPEAVHAYGHRALFRAWLVARLRMCLLVYDAVAIPGRPQRGAWRERL